MLAIVLDRGGYVHDDDDVAAAEKDKAPPYPHVSGPWTGSPLGVKPISWLGVAGIFGSVFAVIVVVSALVVLVRR
ncbi:hypothetical protein ACFV9C_36440 [Kribbella sp. NPDC059898]|uniref:hypothetical protein n=1 Tax=Kribbella sp. NPDC059898 TaxID=3346995 RepID=UPI0036600470